MKSKICLGILFLFPLFFSQLLFAQAPANDNCSGAILLTSSTTCSNTAGTVTNATSSGIAANASCGGAPDDDVWYMFVAQSPSSTITLSGISNGANKLGNATPTLELFSGTCSGLTSLACDKSNSTSITYTALTPGNTYYVRIYSGATGFPSSSGTFSICVTHPAPPANDDCTGAISLTAGVSCSNTSGTLVNALSSSGIPTGCAGTGTHYDVWYSFVAVKTYELISLTASGSSFTNPEIQLFSGSCGSLTSLQCGTTSISATGLTAGNTYYVRVSNVGSFISSNGNFSICVYHPAASTIDYSRSYVNITKGSTGGTVNPGDTLEMRATFVVRNSGSVADSLAFYDTLFHNAGLRLVPGSICWRTNEGKVYGNNATTFTDALDSDPGWYYTSGLDTVIRVNVGIGATSSTRGKLLNTSKPSVYGSTCIVMATYRVVVYAAYNTAINFKTGAITYRDGNTGIYNNVTFTQNNLIVYQSPGLCPNAVSPSTLGAESNGTFGSPSPTTAPLARNRSTTPYTTYSYKPFTSTGGPDDYSYGIANNTSQVYTTSTNYSKPDATNHRLFQLWDITGDHTNASNTSLGNSPCDTTSAVTTSNPCGYMLIINSAYAADTAFTHTITGLCPNTYYEISAWFKNICYKCGCDSLGVGTSGSGYIPTATGDSAGVRPNIAFDVNGVDYYTTGDILYQGLTGGPTGSDAANRWVKRGFTYLTGAAQTSFTLTLRNNAPGGGGNDWALDDISVATCSPDMSFTPSNEPVVCSGNPMNVTGTVTSYFNNYTNYIWQKSTDGGSTWTNVTLAQTGSPTVNGSGQYVYSVSYESEQLTTANAGILYKLVTATTPANLSSSSCTLSGGVEVVPNIQSCSPVLGTNFISFNARQEGSTAILKWTTSKETELLQFVIEGSTDGRTFAAIGKLSGDNNSDNALNSYTWSEPYRQSKYYYRIKMEGRHTGNRYSKISALDALAPTSAQLLSVINPFHNNLLMDVQVAEAGVVKLQLIDNNGVAVRSQNVALQQGLNRITISQMENLPSGMYTLKLITNQNTISKKLVKQ